MQNVVRVLVIDDSAFVRKVVSQMLSRSPFLEVVGTARDGEEGLELAERFQPDVITLDLMMPGMDGIEFLREQMARKPLPVVVCSIAHDCGELALAAFDAGAVEFVQKPTALATDRVYEIGDELIEKVKAAAGVRMARLKHSPLAPHIAVESNGSQPHGPTNVDIVVIGISTGGPQALRQLIPRFPANFPVPVAVVLHMPVGYTEMYAQRLDAISKLHVTEARDGELVQPGMVLIAPAGRHLTFVRDGVNVRAHLDLRPFDMPHRPSVDVMFRSAAEVFGARTLGVVMTGMGDDGLLGSAHIKSHGGRIVTEAEVSCIVYGMPRVVAEAALSDRSASLDDMADAITELV